MGTLLPDDPIDVLETAPVDNPDWHRDHQALMHSYVNRVAQGARGDTWTLVDVETIERRQPHQVLDEQVYSHNHTSPGQVTLDIHHDMRACVIEASADVTGWLITNDNVHGGMCEVRFLLRAVNGISVALADIPEFISPLPPATLAPGEVWPLHWVCFPDGSGATGGGGSSGTGSIAGTVTRVGGAPVEGVQINLSTESGTYVRSASTNEFGDWVIPTLADDTYVAEFIAPPGEIWPATGSTTLDSPVQTVSSGGAVLGVDAQLAATSDGGGGVISFNVGTSNWVWTTTDPLNPAAVNVAVSTTAPPPTWRWQQRVDGGTWVAIPGMEDQNLLSYEATAKDPDGNPAYDVDETTEVEIRVSDDGGTNWSAVQTITIVYDIPPE